MTLSRESGYGSSECASPGWRDGSQEGSPSLHLDDLDPVRAPMAGARDMRWRIRGDAYDCYFAKVVFSEAV
jgi:hypothetical protein